MTQWQQGSSIELTIASLSDRGDGVGRWGDRVVFVPDTVTGDRVRVRLVRVKKQYAHGQIQSVLKPSEYRIRPRCLVADKCGGCQWQHVEDVYQRQAKVQIVLEALERIGGFTELPIASPLFAATHPLHYRNKATYPLGLSQQQTVQAGYYRRGSHQIVNLNQCPVQDERLDCLLADIKLDIAAQQWTIYNERQHMGQLRHLSLRIGRRTGEVLVTLISRNSNLPDLLTQAQQWQAKYPELVGVCVNINPKPGNIIFGDRTHCIVGRDYLEEEFAGLTLQLRSETFFQVNTEVAEALLAVIAQRLELQGTETLLDAYCGIGTFTLPLAQRVKTAIGVERQSSAITQARANAQLNHITNAEFHCAAVEDWLTPEQPCPDIVLLDPPRKGCDRTVISALLSLLPPQILYISCKPATLARDLKLLCADGQYQLVYVQPADFFPQTPHVECAAFLQRRTE
ncbi:MAG: 23S rRNA (uracil(1939)-C(5))-methyltransferase RlmD [Spirulina sp. SIO3F2]|nr:23S rRNA (uracil(1939)-C(5))-methyltransferase RlmD [Spirulina sp. SIO3F2]